MLYVAVTVGRLLEIRFADPFTVEDVPSYMARVKGVLMTIPGRLVCAMDLRFMSTMPKPVADAFLTMMRSHDKLDFAAYVAPRDNATVKLQIWRLILEAENDARKSFEDTATAEAWLADALTPAERARLHEFLATV